MKKGQPGKKEAVDVVRLAILSGLVISVSKPSHSTWMLRSRMMEVRANQVN